MANEGRVRVVVSGTTVTINPAMEFQVSHRAGWAYRDLNGQLRATDVPTDGKITKVEWVCHMGAISRADWTQLKDWMVAGTEVEVFDDASGSTYSSSNSFKGFIESLDSGAFSQAKMTTAPYRVVVEVYEHSA